MAQTLAEETTAEDRFTVAVWRRLRDTGAPLSEEDIADLGAKSGLDAASVAQRLAAAGERDADGRLAGLVGLSVADHPHRLMFEEHALSTWCAWDPFFLVPSLGGNARLETADPVSGEVFTVQFVEGRAVPAADGREPVLSMVDRGALRTADAASAADGDEQPATSDAVEELWSSF